MLSTAVWYGLSLVVTLLACFPETQVENCSKKQISEDSIGDDDGSWLGEKYRTQNLWEKSP